MPPPRTRPARGVAAALSPSLPNDRPQPRRSFCFQASADRPPPHPLLISPEKYPRREVRATRATHSRGVQPNTTTLPPNAGRHRLTIVNPPPTPFSPRTGDAAYFSTRRKPTARSLNRRRFVGETHRDGAHHLAGSRRVVHAIAEGGQRHPVATGSPEPKFRSSF